MKPFGLIVFFISILFVTEVSAQYTWKIVHPDSVEADSFTFQDISCNGKNCTAVGYYYNSNTYRRLWNSTDGGETWVIKDPQLPDSLSESNLTGVLRLDSLHIYIIGLGGLFLNSSDAGESWHLQVIDSLPSRAFHFSDLLTGIRIGGQQVLTTLDGGETWKSIPVDSVNLESCWSGGGGKFQIYDRNKQIIFSTTDNWVTRDTSAQIAGLSDSLIKRCVFSDDTTYAYGVHVTPGFPITTAWRGLILRNAHGLDWEGASLLPSDSGGVSQIWSVTRPRNDTVVAGGWSKNKIVISTDKGTTWAFDTLPIPKRGIMTDVNKLIMLDNGNVLGIYTDNRLSPRTAMFLGQRNTNSVHGDDVNQVLDVFPNPANQSLIVILPDGIESIVVRDILGRVRTREEIFFGNTYNIDVSGFEGGIYNIMAATHFSIYFAQIIVSP